MIKRGPTWGQHWIGPYESAYSLLQKFAWANVLGPADLCKLFFGYRKPSPRDCLYAIHPRTLLSNGWMESSSSAPDDLLFTLKQRTLSHFAGAWSHALATDECLSYCRQCLLLGFHSPFYQIGGLVKCPIHQDWLQDECSQCGAPTPRYAICEEAFRKPLVCGACDRPIAGVIDLASFQQHESFMRAARELLLPLAVWLQQLSGFSSPLTGESLSYSNHVLRVQDLLRPEHRDNGNETAFMIAHAIIPCPLNSELLYAPKGSIRTIVVSPSTGASASPLATARGHAAVFKSIRRYIQRSYLRAHRRCEHLAIRGRGTIELYGKCYAEVDPEACPIAQAAALWRSHGIRTGVLNVKHRAWRTWSDICGFDTNDYSEDANHKYWAWRLLFRFYGYCAIALHIACVGRYIMEEDDPDERYDALVDPGAWLRSYLDFRDPEPYQDAMLWPGGVLGLSRDVAQECLTESKSWCERYRRLEPIQYWRARNSVMARMTFRRVPSVALGRAPLRQTNSENLDTATETLPPTA